MKRIVTAIALLAVAVYLIFWGPHWLFLAAATYLGTTCYFEFSGLVAGHGIRRPGIWGVLAGLLILFSPGPILSELSLVMILALAAALRYADLRDVLPQVACVFLGALYAFAPWHFAVLLRQMSVHWLLLALASNWAGDSAAYYVGRSLGKHRLAPVVSPKKSWEGAAGSVAGSVIFGVIYMGYFMPSVRVWTVVLIAVAANIAGQFGDLAESAMKRGAGVKDSGNLLPGHGGMLDRVDSSLFALPVVYVLTQVSASIGL
jgi:phosphatidate cytidylyltransferase